MRDFHKLEVWKSAHQLALSIYATTSGFPRDELYGLTGQIRRAATSIPANIAERCGRQTEADFARFLDLAMGSASELEYHLLLARDLGYVNDAEYDAALERTAQVKRMLGGLLRRLRAES